MAANKNLAVTASAARILRRVSKLILEDPKRLSMGHWARKWDEDGKGPACNTVGCIAGWTVMQSIPRAKLKKMKVVRLGKGAASNARKILGITKEQAARLFYTGPGQFGHFSDLGCWPEKFASRLNRSRTRRGNASITAKRIEHFIKTGK